MQFIRDYMDLQWCIKVGLSVAEKLPFCYSTAITQRKIRRLGISCIYSSGLLYIRLIKENPSPLLAPTRSC